MSNKSKCIKLLVTDDNFSLVTSLQGKTEQEQRAELEINYIFLDKYFDTLPLIKRGVILKDVYKRTANVSVYFDDETNTLFTKDLDTDDIKVYTPAKIDDKFTQYATIDALDRKYDRDYTLEELVLASNVITLSEYAYKFRVGVKKYINKYSKRVNKLNLPVSESLDGKELKEVQEEAKNVFNATDDAEELSLEEKRAILKHNRVYDKSLIEYMESLFN